MSEHVATIESWIMYEGVKPVHWLAKVRCSACDRLFYSMGETRFCPACGEGVTLDLARSVPEYMYDRREQDDTREPSREAFGTTTSRLSERQVNPNMRDVRDFLDRAGVPYETDDGEDLVEDEDFLTHYERTGFTSGSGEWVSVLYSWTRDWDERKRGASMGWPAYLECKVGDAMPKVMDVDEILELVR